MSIACKDCGKEGGKFTMRGADWYCQHCLIHGPSRNISTFPFTTTNIDGSPLVVESMRHLRSLERERGVISVAYNQNSSNW